MNDKEAMQALINGEKIQYSGWTKNSAYLYLDDNGFLKDHSGNLSSFFSCARYEGTSWQIAKKESNGFPQAFEAMINKKDASRDDKYLGIDLENSSLIMTNRIDERRPLNVDDVSANDWVIEA